MWRFRLSLMAEVDFARLTRAVQLQIAERLRWFESHFEHTVSLPLGGKWSGFFKLRAGDWRIVYEADNTMKCIIVHVIDHRSRIYKRGPPQRFR